MSHAVSHYDVWVSCEELIQIQCSCAVCWHKDALNIVAVYFAKDYIEFLSWSFVLWVHDNPAIHAVCNVLPYTIEAVGTTVVVEDTCIWWSPCPCNGLARLYIGSSFTCSGTNSCRWAKTCMEVHAMDYIAVVSHCEFNWLSLIY